MREVFLKHECHISQSLEKCVQVISKGQRFVVFNHHSLNEIVRLAEPVVCFGKRTFRCFIHSYDPQFCCGLSKLGYLHFGQTPYLPFYFKMGNHMRVCPSLSRIGHLGGEQPGGIAVIGQRSSSGQEVGEVKFAIRGDSVAVSQLLAPVLDLVGRLPASGLLYRDLPLKSSQFATCRPTRRGSNSTALWG